MEKQQKYEKQKLFWEKAGKIGYGKAMFTNTTVAEHILTKHWQAAINTAQSLGLNSNSKILELGCGDGSFAKNILSARFKHIDAFDQSEAAIKRAQSLAKSDKVHYFVEDIANYQYAENACWDGAFMIGFLHHLKAFTPAIISRLSKVCEKVIIMEINGNNLIRKLLEFLPAYRQAGEESFRLKELKDIFTANGYQLKTIRKLILVPSFLPKVLFPPFKRLEKFVESKSLLNSMCSTYILGFEHTKIKTKL